MKRKSHAIPADPRVRTRLVLAVMLELSQDNRPVPRKGKDCEDVVSSPTSSSDAFPVSAEAKACDYEECDNQRTGEGAYRMPYVVHVRG